MRSTPLPLISGLLVGCAALLLLPAAAPSAVVLPEGLDLAQEADTLAPPADTLEAGATGAAGQAAPTSDTATTFRSMPDLPRAGTSFAVRRFTCDRSCLLDHNAIVLMDVLEREMPGLTLLRGSYFGGPHQLRSGLLGPGFTEVRIDGRPVYPLGSGQVDLSRIPVGHLDEITVTETPFGVTVDGASVRREEPGAYSRITAGTGVPGVETIGATFTNGLGRHLEISTGIDVLNAAGEGAGGDRFDFWGQVAWLPGEDGGGVELQWRNQSVDRTGLEAASLDLRDLRLMGRGRLGDDVWINVSAGNSRRTMSGVGATEGGTGGEESGAVDSSAVEVDALSAELRLGSGGEFLSARLEARDGPGQLRTRLDLSGGLEPVEGLTLTGAVSGSRWHRFDGWTVEGGAAYRPDLGLDVEVGVGGALGVRGAPRPLADRADSVSFRQAQARASATWGPLSATVRGIYQDVSRQLPFGGSFDPGLPEAGPGVRVGGVEGTLQAPLLPLGWLLGAEVEPIRLSGTWRHQEILDGPDPGSGGEDGSSDDPRVLYLPTDQARVSAFFHDSFFQGDLRVQAEVAVRHRSPMATVDPAGGAGEVSGWTTVDWNLMLNLKDVRIWWRVDNTRSAPWEDVVGLARPATRNVFGVKWEFFN